MARLPAVLLLALASWAAPAGAQEYVVDAMRPLFHATLLAQRMGSACGEVDAALAPSIATGLAHLQDRHGADLLALRRALERRAGADGIEHLANTLATRFGERLQRQDGAARRAECAALATYLESAAARPRQALVEESFRKWFARQQQDRHIDCAALPEAARLLSRRLLSGPEGPPDLLRADARMAAHGAGWCQHIQEAAAGDGIRVAGNFGKVRETAQAIADAAMPQLSGRDPATAVRQGRDRAQRYLAEPDWI